MSVHAVRNLDPHAHWRPGRGSQNERILAVLLDGEPHTVQEIHSLAGFSRMNSRVSELRKHGWNIESFHIEGKSGPEGYGYRLVGEPEPSASTGAVASLPERPTAVDLGAASGSPVQLVLA